MTAFVPSITDQDIMKAVRAYLISQVVPAGAEVVDDSTDRVAMPNPPYVVMNHLTKPRLSTNVDSISSTTIGTITTTKAQVIQSTRYGMQLDMVGVDSSDGADWAQVLTTTWFSGIAEEFLQSYGIGPLFNDDPRYAPWSNGENQWEHRWIVNIYLQVNPALIYPSSSFIGANVGVVDVETFPIV